MHTTNIVNSWLVDIIVLHVHHCSSVGQTVLFMTHATQRHQQCGDALYNEDIDPAASAPYTDKLALWVEDLLWALEIDVYITEHFTAHTSAKYHHLTYQCTQAPCATPYLVLRSTPIFLFPLNCHLYASTTSTSTIGSTSGTSTSTSPTCPSSNSTSSQSPHHHSLQTPFTTTHGGSTSRAAARRDGTRP